MGTWGARTPPPTPRSQAPACPLLSAQRPVHEETSGIRLARTDEGPCRPIHSVLRSCSGHRASRAGPSPQNRHPESAAPAGPGSPAAGEGRRAPPNSRNPPAPTTAAPSVSPGSQPEITPRKPFPKQLQAKGSGPGCVGRAARRGTAAARGGAARAAGPRARAQPSPSTPSAPGSPAPAAGRRSPDTARGPPPSREPPSGSRPASWCRRRARWARAPQGPAASALSCPR